MATACPYALDRNGTDVHAENALLRSQGPVASVELPGGVSAWTVVDHALAKKVLNDARFVKNPQAWPAFAAGEIPSDWPLISWVVMDNMTTHDGADHSRLRRLVSQAFTPRRVAATRPMVEAITTELLDRLAAVPEGEVVDLKGKFAYALPAAVICDLFGVPAESRAEVLRGGEVTTSTSLTEEEAAANVAHWHQALGDLVDAKRREPGDDLTSVLIEAASEGQRLTHEELVGTLFLMLGAGSETVMNLLCHAVKNLLANPDQLKLALSGEVAWEEVAEEVMRVQSPINQLPFRFATEDVELGGVTIRKGDPVLMGFAATGRDPQLHGEDADRFDITRPNKTHLSLGHGAHFCMGAPLARMEAAVALPALFNRFPDLAIAVSDDELVPMPSFIMNGPLTLPVRLGRERTV
ncbi:cytochrome P450 family protein [Streptomyces sp. 12297]|uniref:cytochrome P450 family protein n=1 Tax=Streptomyces sp. NBC_00239 TaxID=2903640 RepID=UPI002E2D35A3|nr:cytochrome P450 [Streptomyces sp. NBC_00239]